MKNLEQIRAASALALANEATNGNTDVGGANGGDAIKKIPAMLMTNGLLATLAFALEEKSDNERNRNALVRPGYAAILSHLAGHLSSEGIEITEATPDARTLIDHLVENDSATLRRATAEALQWFGYARRFVRKQEELP